MDKVVVYCDGGSRGNPGPSALGVVIKTIKGEIIEEIGEYLGIQTNNYAEYKVKNECLKALHSKVLNSIGTMNISFTHVYREDNKEADAMVNQVLDSQK